MRTTVIIISLKNYSELTLSQCVPKARCTAVRGPGFTFFAINITIIFLTVVKKKQLNLVNVD